MTKSISEIRQIFFDYFQKQGHKIIASSSLVPNDDQTLLFTNAGMNQFKKIFLNQEKINYSRAVSSQRCIRVGGKHNDLENVGYTERHHTFFEMLGNFSFGDYFKKEAIIFAWEILTNKKWFNLPKERLFVTVYQMDNEAYDIWTNIIGLSNERVIKIGDDKGIAYSSDNFWQMSDIGPCGPCSEIFYDNNDPIIIPTANTLKINDDRYLEIWNLVFMQFDRQLDGKMLNLTQKSIDTGMGLERIASVIQNVKSNYKIDIFRKLIKSIAKIINTKDINNKSLYIIADHIRASAFLIADGVIPSNENRGYVLRRIIRRAIRHGNVLGIKNIFLYKFIQPLIEILGDSNKELFICQNNIEHILKLEEEQFAKTLEYGLDLLNKELKNIKNDTLNGQIAFRLYDTFGFPIDLTTEICRERNIKLNLIEFQSEMEQQRQRARKVNAFKLNNLNKINYREQTTFLGYHQHKSKSIVKSIYINNKEVESINFVCNNALIILDQTPFYGESGGQIGDIGIIKNTNCHFIVKNTQKDNNVIMHIGILLLGQLHKGDSVETEVDIIHRNLICVNHSATHILHTAVSCVLGKHVIQKGSLINDKYLRFDFLHFQNISIDEINQIENIVNDQIRYNLPIVTDIMNINDAKTLKVKMLFTEKYEQNVRVVQIGNFSKELCGGTHISNTGNIGLFHIQFECGIAAGIHRIQALTGQYALIHIQKHRTQLFNIAKLTKSNVNDLHEKVISLIKRINHIDKELQKLRYEQMIKQSIDLSHSAINIKGIKLIIKKVNNVHPDLLSNMVGLLKKTLGSSIIVLATVVKNKISLIVSVTEDLTQYVRANEMIVELAKKINGKGGGKPHLAKAGGNNIKALETALSNVQSLIDKRLL
ncbi:MAG: alanine--tRNA ligase [Pantoea sp. Brub]|nr:alanine--tRNA ligase [Pantoea sp. Brub]